MWGFVTNATDRWFAQMWYDSFKNVRELVSMNWSFVQTCDRVHDLFKNVTEVVVYTNRTCFKYLTFNDFLKKVAEVIICTKM